MFRIVRNRILVSIPILLGVSLLAFLLIRWVPGDPVQIMLGERGGSPELVAEMKANLGLDRPLWSQYFIFVGNLFTGDFGTSLVSREPVMSEFLGRFPATLELGLAAMLWATLIGLPLGIVAAVKQNTFADYSLMSISLIGYSMPIFWWGLLLILLFSVTLGWTPVSGRISEMYDVTSYSGLMLIDSWFSNEPRAIFLNAMKHLVLPAVALGTVPLAAIARMTRTSVLEVLKEDYIRTARAKGLSQRIVIGRHALRNAMVPVITVIGLMLGAILTGAILTETIFSWPGIGKWLVNSVSARDYPVVQGALVLICGIILIVNLLVDVLCALLNPFMRGSS